MDIIQIDERNIDGEHICCAIGNDKVNKTRSESKKEWMKQCFKDGLVFKRLNERGKVFIEYIPIEKAWKPVIGENYMVINCLWVSGKFKGNGISSVLLDECVNDSKKLDMNGIAVVTSTKVKPFLTDRKFFEKKGFVTVDIAPPYFELMALKFNSNEDNPKFSENVKKGISSFKNGFAFIYSNQCPFMEEYVGLLTDVSKRRGIPYQVKKIESYKEAKEIGSPFGTLGIYYNGEFTTHELMTESKFEKFIDSIS